MTEVGKQVKIFLINGFTYRGIVLEENEIFLKIKDKFNQIVSIGKTQIQTLMEVENVDK
jgi:sRNA-binding regulator protein Hfq